MYSYDNDSCIRNLVGIASLIKFLIWESLTYEYIKCSNTPIHGSETLLYYGLLVEAIITSALPQLLWLQLSGY